MSLIEQYHLHGTGPAVCVVIPGGPGLSWEYLRMPALEQHLTVVYPGQPGLHRATSVEALDHLLDHLGRERVYLPTWPTTGPARRSWRPCGPACT